MRKHQSIGVAMIMVVILGQSCSQDRGVVRRKPVSKKTPVTVSGISLTVKIPMTKKMVVINPLVSPKASPKVSPKISPKLVDTVPRYLIKGTLLSFQGLGGLEGNLEDLPPLTFVGSGSAHEVSREAFELGEVKLSVESPENTLVVLVVTSLVAEQSSAGG